MALILRSVTKKFTPLFLFTLFFSTALLAQNTSTSGDWGTTSTWQGGTIPGTGSTVNVNHDVTLDRNISILGGYYSLNANVTDPTEGPGYTLTINKSGNTEGTLDVKAGTTIFEGAAALDNAYLYVRSGATLIVGGLTINNNSHILIEAGGTLIVNGNVTDANNGQGSTKVQGYFMIYGNYAATTGSVEIEGTGSLETTGSLTTNGSSTVFGSGNDCNVGPCSGASLACGSGGVSYTNRISPTTQTICAGQTPATMTSTTNAPSPSYQWQVSTTSGGAGFTNIAGATSSTYSPGVLNANTWYRVVITTASCTSTSPSSAIEISGVSVTQADAGSSQVICTFETATLAANAPAIGTGSWSVFSGPSTSLTQFSNTGNPTAVFTPATSGTYTLRWSISNGSCPASTSDVTIGVGTVTSLTWTGNAGTHEWENAENWACPQVPAMPHDVIIPAGFHVVVSAPAFAKSITIGNGATLTLSENVSLQVAGTFINNGTFNGGNAGILAVSGDFVNNNVFHAQSGTVRMNGNTDQNIYGNNSIFNVLEISKAGGAVTLVSALRLAKLLKVESATAVHANGHLTLLSQGITTDLDGRIGPLPSGASINGNVIAQRYMDAIGSNVFRYIASPVKNVTRPANVPNLYRYTATGWVKYTGTLTTGQGYATLTSNSQITWSVTGQVHTGSMTWNFPTDGWYLLGNPYPSPIQWSNNTEAWTIDLSKVSTTIAVTDNSVTGYPNYFRYYQYDSTDPTTWGVGPLQNGVVAMGQSFWVYSLAGGSLTIHENAKIEENITGEFYRTKDGKEPNVLGIAVTNGKTMDQTYLQIAKGATPRFELTHDLPKLWNHDMNVFLLDETRSEMLRHSVGNIPVDAKIFLGVNVTGAGEYQLSFNNSENFTESLHLVDRYEGVSTPVNNLTSYSFIVRNASEPILDRFYLTLSPENIQKLERNVAAYPNPVKDRLFLRSNDDLPAEAQLYNQQGKLMDRYFFTGEGTIDMNTLPQGVYILKINTRAGLSVKRIIKQ